MPSQRDNARLLYYDRTAVTHALNSNLNGLAPHALTIRWTYTVPAGRVAYVESAQVTAWRETAAAPLGTVGAVVRCTPVAGVLCNIVGAWLFDNTVGARQAEALGSMGYLSAGDVIDGITFDQGVGGTASYRVDAKYTEAQA